MALGDAVAEGECVGDGFGDVELGEGLEEVVGQTAVEAVSSAHEEIDGDGGGTYAGVGGPTV